MNVQPSFKITELESIRGLAALLIVFVHIPYSLLPFENGLVKNGYLMVELFFVLSGFVIFNAYDGKITTGKELARFQFLRFARLYPVHLLFLLAFGGIEWIKYVATVKFGIASPNSVPFKENNLWAFFEQLFLIQAIYPSGHALTFNAPAWSISVEFYTYMIFGLVLLFCKSSKLWLFGAIFIGGLGLIITKNTLGFLYLLQCLTGFFLGCLTAHFTKNLSIKLPSFLSFVVFVTIIVFLIVKTNSAYDPVIFLLSAILIVTLVKSEGGFLKRLLNFKFLGWLGMISYSLYMSHSAVLWVVNNGLRLILKRPDIIGPEGKAMPNLTVVETLLTYGVILLLVFAVSHVTYRLIEAPLRDKSRAVKF